MRLLVQICEIFRDTYFEEPLRTTTFEKRRDSSLEGIWKQASKKVEKTIRKISTVDALVDMFRLKARKFM